MSDRCDGLCEDVIQAKSRLDDGDKILAMIPAMAKNIELLMMRDAKLASFIELKSNLEGFANTVKILQRWILILAPIFALIGAIALVIRRLDI